jgi:hypothetical protein
MHHIWNDLQLNRRCCTAEGKRPEIKTKPRQNSEPQRQRGRSSAETGQQALCPVSPRSGRGQAGPETFEGRKRLLPLWNAARAQRLSLQGLPPLIQSNQPSSSLQRECMSCDRWASSFTLLPNSDRGWLHQSPLTFSLGSMPISLPPRSC